jgi:hypothetical protein
MLGGHHAIISVAEIESSSRDYGTAVKQMERHANLMEFILKIVFKKEKENIL